jgi:hypothetical protein
MYCPFTRDARIRKNDIEPSLMLNNQLGDALQGLLIRDSYKSQRFTRERICNGSRTFFEKMLTGGVTQPRCPARNYSNFVAQP